MASFTKIYWLSHLGSWSSVSVSVGGLYISSEAERRYWTKVPSWCDVAGSSGVSATRSTWGSSARCCSQTSPGSSRPRCRSLAWPVHIYNIYNISTISTISISIHIFQNLYPYPYIYFRIWSGQIILSLCSLSFVSVRSLLDIFISPPSSGCFWKVNLSCLFTIVFLSALDKYICMKLFMIYEHGAFL